MVEAFSNYNELRTAIDSFRLGGNSRIECERRYGPIRDWNVTSVTDMHNLFSDYENFNEDISG